MVVTLKNQEKVEMRSLPNFQEIETHIRERMVGPGGYRSPRHTMRSAPLNLKKLEGSV